MRQPGTEHNARTVTAGGGAAFPEEFLLALIHDTRSLLRRSLTSAQILERAGEPLSDEGRLQLSSVIHANQEMDRFLGRLADFANAAHPSNALPLPLSAVIQVSIQQACAPDELPNVRVGPLDDVIVSPVLQRVFVELLRNALLFRGQQPPLVRIESHVSGAECSIEFHDNGIGVDAKYLDRIFQPLVRLHSRDAYPGFGLGLPISRRIVESLGGRIELCPGEETGSVAVVNVPVSAQAA